MSLENTRLASVSLACLVLLRTAIFSYRKNRNSLGKNEWWRGSPGFGRHGGFVTGLWWRRCGPTERGGWRRGYWSGFVATERRRAGFRSRVCERVHGLPPVQLGFAGLGRNDQR